VAPGAALSLRRRARGALSAGARRARRDLAAVRRSTARRAG
jgi:hypothetical protein